MAFNSSYSWLVISLIAILGLTHATFFYIPKFNAETSSWTSNVTSLAKEFELCLDRKQLSCNWKNGLQSLTGVPHKTTQYNSKILEYKYSLQRRIV